MGLLHEFLPVVMFVTLALLLFTGFPVAGILGGTAIAFGLLGIPLGLFQPVEYFNIVTRIWYGAGENLTLIAIPTFVFMGTMLERSGVAGDLLHCLQVVLRRVPGVLPLSVALMGTILAAMTGIIGASVTMMTLLALPTMLRQGYDHRLATGTIAASGTLGILIPPSIMLVIMADLLAVSVGNLFLAALVPGLTLAALYVCYILGYALVHPERAPPLPPEAAAKDWPDFLRILLRGLLPPVFLIVLLKVAIFGGWATPTEAGGVGAAGATLLALVNRRLDFEVLKDVCERTALTVGMIFFIFIGATAFSYVYRSMGGDELVEHIINSTGFGSWSLLILMMGIVFFLGFFLDWFEIILIAIPVFVPIVELLDFGDHVAKADLIYWFTILMAVNLQTSFLTPPFGFALFYMRGVTPPEVELSSIYRGIVPFVLLQLAGLGLCMAFPGIVTWLMHYALDGN